MSEFYVLELQSGVRVNVATLPGEDPSRTIRDYFASANRPYERWVNASLGPLDELFSELSAEGRLPLAPFQAAQPSVTGGDELILPEAQPARPTHAREAPFTPPRRLQLPLHQDPLEHGLLTLALTNPISRADLDGLAERVRTLLDATRTAAHIQEERPRVPATLPVEERPPSSLLARLSLARRVPPRLALEALVTPQRLPADALADVKLELHFRNEGGAPAELYPALAQLQDRSGWGGPTWTLAVTAAGFPPERLKLVELRTGYGPPGIPPTSQAFTPFLRQVPPGAVEVHTLTACWIPQALLPADSVRPDVIDPEGMNGIGTWPHLGRSSVLVLGQSRAALQSAMERTRDFLRGQRVLFLPPRALLQLTLGYHQQPWASFKPQQSWSLLAPPLDLLTGEREGGPGLSAPTEGRG
ncbi:hypothetical protein [Hyalangium minutum]|uniref:Uncharacterized protein n=1 Tax=Hyalangium minutum TaxID=394096 RepID=A0A085WJB1_9BACT|nr:hypothetical protein [Hyalangium minutum]KFE67774.1 hypothetical protein DB31_8257 [Hyalangium minutum]